MLDWCFIQCSAYSYYSLEHEILLMFLCVCWISHDSVKARDCCIGIYSGLLPRPVKNTVLLWRNYMLVYFVERHIKFEIILIHSKFLHIWGIWFSFFCETVVSIMSNNDGKYWEMKTSSWTCDKDPQWKSGSMQFFKFCLILIKFSVHLNFSEFVSQCVHNFCWVHDPQHCMCCTGKHFAVVLLCTHLKEWTPWETYQQPWLCCPCFVIGKYSLQSPVFQW